jgi:energy-coupling factor transport system ATP-binding protein
VDLDVQHGERILLLGPSGAGKSTLLLAIAGLLDPDGGDSEGEILVEGLDPRAARGRTGLVMQDPESQIVMARAGDDVAFGLENLEVPGDEIWPRVDEALRAVGFPYGRDHATSALSGGEQQRLVLAGTVALRPSTLLLDEPTANLDPDGARLVRGALARVLAATTSTLVLVEHRVREVLDLVDRVVVLASGGGVIADGRPGDLFAARGPELAKLGVWVPDLALPSRAASGASGAVLLGAEQVSFRYPAATRPAVAAADLQLRTAEAVAIVGPNGSGKSTLALMLAGLLVPTTGEVRGRAELGGPDLPLHKWPANILANRVGTVFQDPEHQFLRRTVVDELALGPRRTGMSVDAVRARVDDLLGRLHLDHLAEANPFTLSGGEKRRLSVATALSTDPHVVLLDEPTFGQDRRTWLELLSMMSALRDGGTSVCCVTHDQEFADALSDRVVVVRDGAIVREDSTVRGAATVRGGTAVPETAAVPKSVERDGAPDPKSLTVPT